MVEEDVPSEVAAAADAVRGAAVVNIFSI